MPWGSEYGWSLESIGIGLDDLYRNEDGELRMIPDLCRLSGLEDCCYCHWFSDDIGECSHPKRDRK